MSIFCAIHNALKDGRGVTMYPPALDGYGPENLHDDTEWPAIWGSVAANPYFSSDLAMWDNSSLDAWLGGVPTGGFVTSGPGSCDQVNAGAESGSCARLTNGGYVLNTATLVAGHSYTARARVWNSSGSVTARLFVHNLKTNRFLQVTSLVWSAVYNYAGVSAATSYATLAVTFDAETLAVMLGAEAEIDVYIQTTGGVGEYTYVDNFTIHQHWNLVSLHGVRFDPALAVKVQSSDDGITWADVAGGAITLRAPSCYVLIPGSKVAKRFVRVIGIGTPTTEPALDEVWVSDAFQIGRARDGAGNTLPHIASFRVSEQQRQDRQELKSGAMRVTNLGPWAAQTLEVELRHYTMESYQLHRDRLQRATGAGAAPIVVVTPEEEEDLCLRGRLEMDFSASRTTQGDNDFRSTTLRVVGETFSDVTA